MNFGCNADGRLEVFARGTDDALLSGVITSDTFVARNADGRLEAFARGTDNALWHIWQLTAGGGWSGWNSLGGVIVADLAASASG